MIVIRWMKHKHDGSILRALLDSFCQEFGL